jgi:hypothetical protein
MSWWFRPIGRMEHFLPAKPPPRRMLFKGKIKVLLGPLREPANRLRFDIRTGLCPRQAETGFFRTRRNDVLQGA